MIKVNELRYKNLFILNGLVSEVAGFHPNDKNSDDAIVFYIRKSVPGDAWKPINAQVIDPIPLTPEWLKQFGWQLVDQGSGPYYWLEKQCWFHIHLSADGSFYANFNNNAVPIKYHHQLQNLYFALTGEELTTE